MNQFALSVVLLVITGNLIKKNVNAENTVRLIIGESCNSILYSYNSEFRVTTADTEFVIRIAFGDWMFLSTVKTFIIVECNNRIC